MCGIIAVVSKSKNGNLNDILHHMNSSQTNRGQDSSGYGLFTGEEIKVLKSKGSPEEPRVYSECDFEIEKCDRGIGVTRYATSGVNDFAHAQPFKENNLVVVHNGNVANKKELQQKFLQDNPKTNSDTEIITKIIAQQSNPLEGFKILEKYATGAFNLIALNSSGQIFVYRDSIAQHPLHWTRTKDYILVASETSAFPDDDSRKNYEIKPGEVLVIEESELKIEKISTSNLSFCPFQLIYFMNEDSEVPVSAVLEEEQNQPTLVRDLRKEVGKKAWEQEDRKDKFLREDYICVPVLTSGKHFAKGYSQASGLKLEKKLTPNRDYRSYMEPEDRAVESEKSRIEKAKLKHKLEDVKEGSRFILIDDSQVRGDTSKAITESLRAAGAEEVHWLFIFPKITSPCFYGLDHSEQPKLIAVDDQGRIRSNEEIAEIIDADSVRFGSKEIIESAAEASRENLCWGCTARSEYPTEVPKEIYDQFIA